MNFEKSDRLRVAIDAALEAAEVIESFKNAGSMATATASETKVVQGAAMGLVTEADLAAESAIIKKIRTHYPDDCFLAEESHAEIFQAEQLWVIDPIDGTNNFAHGIPHYSVSIAFYESGVARCGVITNPATGELFVAEQGRGAWLNDRRVTVSGSQQLTDSIVATGFYYDRGEMMKATLSTINDLFEQNIRGIRRFGSAALDLAYVGAGRYDAFFEYYLSPWDFGAGKLFVEEAGGKVTNCGGGEIGLQPTHLLATNHSLHDEIQKHLHSDFR